MEPVLFNIPAGNYGPSSTPQPQTSQTPQPASQSSSGGLDSDAVNLTRAIRQHESGGDFTAKGQSGEYGAYQFLPSTWNAWSKNAGVNVPLNEATPEQQNQVAYTQIKQWKDQGYNVGQIASLWNSGDPNAYTGKFTSGAPAKGMNRFGAKYDVPAYAQSVATTYQNLKHAGVTDPSQGAMADSPIAKQNDPTQGDSSITGIPVVDSLLNFFTPAVGDIKNDITGQNSKTALQQLGDLGLTALPFIPGLGELGEGARAAEAGGEAATGLLPRLLGGAAKSGAIGYGADVASHLAQGQTNLGQVLTPGLGTLTGGILGAGGELLSGRGTSVAARLNNSLIKPLQRHVAYGKDPGRTLAELGITANSLDELGTKATAARSQIGSAIGDMGRQIPGNLDLSDTITPLDDAMQTAAQQNNQGLFNRLAAVKTALTNNLGMAADESGNPTIQSMGTRDLSTNSYQQSMAFKSLVGDMTHWTGNPSDDKVLNSALQDVWRNISGVQKTAASNVSPDVRATLEKLNEHYGGLTSAMAAIKHRIPVTERQNILSVNDFLAAILGGESGGGILGGGAAGLGSALLRRAAGTPAVKTRLAAALARNGTGIIPQLLKSAAIRGAVGLTSANQ